MSTFNKYRTKGAYHYDWYKTEPWYKWTVDRCVAFCNGVTLDVGCGDGLLVSKLVGKGLDATGIDPDPDAIQLAKANSPGRFLQQGIDEELPGALEYLTCLNVIEHLDNPDRLREIIRDNVTKGAIIITIDWQGGAFGEDHRKEYTLDELVEFFKEFNPKPFRYKDTEWIGVEIRK